MIITKEESYKEAIVQLEKRGYWCQREWVVEGADKGSPGDYDNYRVVTKWNHNKGPALLLEYFRRGGWELYGPLDTTNLVNETWNNLDKILNGEL